MRQIGWQLLVAAAVSAALLGPARGETPLEALATGECERIGKAVNEGLDARRPDAIYVAAVLHHEGLCVERSTEKAARFYAVALKESDPRAALEIGLRYAFGSPMAQSYTRAAAWMRFSENTARGTESPLAVALPPERENEQSDWMGYLQSLHLYATRLVNYPLSARADGAELKLMVDACPVRDAVKVTVTEQRAKEITGGVARLSGRREIVLAVEDAYRQAFDKLPKLARPGEKSPECMRRPFVFQLR